MPYGAEHRNRSIEATSELGMSMVYSHWGSRSSESAYVRAPARWLGGGGGLSGSGSTIGDEKPRPVPRLSCHGGAVEPPLPGAANNNKNMIIRRKYSGYPDLRALDLRTLDSRAPDSRAFGS